MNISSTYIALQPLLVDATKQPSVVAIGIYTGCGEKDKEQENNEARQSGRI